MRHPALAPLSALTATLALGLLGCADSHGTGDYGKQVGRALQEGHASGARGDLQAMGIAITNYASTESGIPDAAGMDALIPLLEPKYLRHVPRADPWGTPYAFSQDGNSWKLVCAGVDKAFGTADDMEMVDGQVTKMPASYTRFGE